MSVLKESVIATKIVAVNWGEIGSFDLKTNVVSCHSNTAIDHAPTIMGRATHTYT